MKAKAMEKKEARKKTHDRNIVENMVLKNKRKKRRKIFQIFEVVVAAVRCRRPSNISG